MINRLRIRLRIRRCLRITLLLAGPLLGPGPTPRLRMIHLLDLYIDRKLIYIESPLYSGERDIDQVDNVKKISAFNDQISRRFTEITVKCSS